MSINDKIKQILIDKNLTPSYFADEIGVQRSSISHILSGRNRPSFDIIQKIIRRFPELGYEWIMEEDAYGSSSVNQPSTYTNRNGNPIRPVTDRTTNGQPSFYSYGSQPSVRTQRNEIPPVNNNPAPVAVASDVSGSGIESTIPMVPSTDKKVERILIFYTDGSFREYTPSA